MGKRVKENINPKTGSSKSLWGFDFSALFLVIFKSVHGQLGLWWPFWFQVAILVLAAILNLAAIFKIAKCCSKILEHQMAFRHKHIILFHSVNLVSAILKMAAILDLSSYLEIYIHNIFWQPICIIKQREEKSWNLVQWYNDTSFFSLNHDSN